jgi:beta-galactosidase GanA
MFANAALVRPGHQPGQYPSGGPLPHLIDVWRAAAPSIDFLAPDIYFPTVAVAEPPPPSGGLVLGTGPDELIVAGTAVTITFAASVPGKRVGKLTTHRGVVRAPSRWTQ